jgi:hypothetical protein
VRLQGLPQDLLLHRLEPALVVRGSRCGWGVPEGGECQILWLDRVTALEQFASPQRLC